MFLIFFKYLKCDVLPESVLKWYDLFMLDFCYVLLRDPYICFFVRLFHKNPDLITEGSFMFLVQCLLKEVIHKADISHTI
jgi:hypothetical protein